MRDAPMIDLGAKAGTSDVFIFSPAPGAADVVDDLPAIGTMPFELVAPGGDSFAAGGETGVTPDQSILLPEFVHFGHDLL